MDRAARIAAFAWMAAVTPHAFAGDVYKCVGSDGTSYQSAPCTQGQAQSRLALVSATPRLLSEAPGVQQTYRPASQTSSPPARRNGPWRHGALTLGIADDEVLNMPEWGRPWRIARTRMPRGWLEVWTYGNAATGERELHFTNARLTDIVDAPATRVALRQAP